MHHFAYLVLSLFVIFGLSLCATATRAQLAKRTFGAFAFGQLFLPASLYFDLPVLPPLGKSELASLMPLLGLLMNSRVKVTRRDLFGGIAFMIWAGVAGYTATVLTNGDSLVFGPKRITGLSVNDGIAESFGFLVNVGASFWIGRLTIRSPRDLEDALKVLLLFGIIHVPMCLFELRMSPQLHKMVYGYSVISFRNIMRSGGFKPVGFLVGGLAMSIFLFSVVATAGILKQLKVRVAGLGAGVWMLVVLGVLAISKNLGANVFAVIFLLVTTFAGPKGVARVARVLVVAFLFYPVARIKGWIDFDPLVQWIAQYSEERATSLQVRLINEEALAERAMLRPWFGWGGYGRSKVFDENGISQNLLDGAWVITLGESGIVGFLARFSVIFQPVWWWSKHLRHLPKREMALIAGLTLMLAFRVADYLPNGFFTTLPVFFGGALVGLRDSQSTWRQRAVAGPGPAQAGPAQATR